MNSLNLDRLIKKLNNILKYNYELRGVSWLYFVKLHPTFINNYESLINNKIYFKNTFLYSFAIVFKIFKLILYFFYITLFYKKFKDNKFPKKNYNLLVLSHLINDNKLNKNYDYIFDNIYNKLNEKNLHSLIVYLNHIKKKNNSYLILSKNLGIKTNFKYIKKYVLLFFKNQLSRNNKTIEIDLIFNRKLKLEILSTSNIYNEIISDQISILLSRLNIKNLLITYEGYSIERIIINKVKNNNPSINCMAYNHSGIWSGQNSIKIKMYNSYDPDIIFFTGKLHRDRFFNKSDIEVKTDILGSNRNFKVLKKKNKKLTVLFLPEGIISEVEIMLSFAEKLCVLYENINFVFRFHPALISHIKKNSKISSKFKNLKFSKKSFNDDLAIANIAIYRGSTTCVAALSNDIIPLYYDLNDNINIDFLYDLNEFKFNIKNVDEFSKIINNYNNIIKQSVINKKHIEDYCLGLFDNKIYFEKIISLISNE